MDGPPLKRAGTILLAGVGQFAFFFAVAEIYYPGYDVSADTISDLGATCKSGACRLFQPSSDIFNLSISLLGVLLFLFAYYLWKGSGSRSLSVFEFLSGVGALGVGVFNETFGVAHVFFSAFTFLAIGIQAILVYKVAKPPLSYFSALCGVVSLVAMVFYATDTYLGLGQGGMERMIVYPALIQGMAFGGYLVALGEFLRG
jgi:hypothetical membrane protein